MNVPARPRQPNAAPEVAARIVSRQRAGQSVASIGRALHMTCAEVRGVLREAKQTEPIEVEVALIAGAGGLANGAAGELAGERWLIVGVGGGQVWLFGLADGRPFGSAAEAGRALGVLVGRRPAVRFVALPLLLLAAVVMGAGPCPGCGAVIGMRDRSCQDPACGGAGWRVTGDQPRRVASHW